MSSKRWLLALSVGSIAAVAILASSLHDVHFEPGRSFSAPPAAGTASPLTIVDTVSSMPLWKVLLFWVLLSVNVVILFFLLPPAARKRILRQTITFALTAFAILMALRYRMIQLPLPDSSQPRPTGSAPPGSQGNALLPEFLPPHVAPWWLFWISFLVLAVFLTLLWLAIRWWRRGLRTRSSELDAIETIARSSLGQIASGRDWSDVIIQSYVRMSEAVSARRGLQRLRSMTPREFAGRLEQAGLPAHSVSRLTRLFESARYGAGASSQSDVNEAVACLNSILQACGQAQ
jgi:hypothetical protein